MSTVNDRMKGFRELPSLKAQMQDLNLKLVSLENIKASITQESYLTIKNNNEGQINEIAVRIENLKNDIVKCQSEIELDSKVLDSENSIVEKDLNEIQLLFERGAMDKMEYNTKRSPLQNRIAKNKALLRKNQSWLKEIEFCATHVGSDKGSFSGNATLNYNLSGVSDSFRNMLIKAPVLLKSKLFLVIVAAAIVLFAIVKIFGSTGTIKIGNQAWMTKNLNVDHYRNGDIIPQVQNPKEWNNLETGAWCYNQKSGDSGKIYGKLYNWYAVNDPRGLAPKGWHMPDKVDWETLLNQLGGEKTAGDKLKEKGTKSWKGPNASANNSSGFTGQAAGAIEGNEFIGSGEVTAWWSITEKNDSKVWALILRNADQAVVVDACRKNCGLSIRCLKD